MQWSNYVIIEDLKLAVEVHKTDDIDEYQEQILEEIFNKGCSFREDICEDNIDDLSINDICELADAHDKISTIAGMDMDQLFVTWLKYRDISFEILESDEIDINQYKEDGYNIIEI